MAKIAVIIPVFDEGDKLTKCLAALDQQDDVDFEVYVRDNNTDNVLFTAAINEGIRNYYLDPVVEFVLLLNQDAYLKPKALATLVDFMQRQPRCGIACPVQMGANGAISWGGSLEAFPFGVHKEDIDILAGPPQETYWGNGACMLVRMQAIREVGLLDENMRFMCSDADYSFTLRSRGWSVFVVPQAHVEHVLESSAETPNPRLTSVKLRDALYFAKKWLNGQLYKDLSYEGPQLTPLGVKAEIEKLERYLMTVDAILESGLGQLLE